MRILFPVGLLLCGFSSLPAGEFPEFEAKVLSPNVGEVCYAVTVADVNNDQKTDVVAVTENRVIWFENPTWKEHTLIENQTIRDNVCIAPYDIDGDGNIDFALGAGWTKVGTIQWITRGEKPDDKWTVHLIGEEPWLHRMRFADVLGTGKPQLVISPLNKTQGEGVRLTAFSIPENPRTERWQPTVMDDSLNRMHNHWHLDFNNNGTIDTLTASAEGVFLVEKDDQKGWTKTQLGKGAPGNDPAQTGAGEIKVGTLKSGARYIVTVEPMHGQSLVCYTEPEKEGELWQRHVIDDTLNRGHALWVADLDHDGDEEIMLGHSDKGTGPIQGPGIYVYEATNASGTEWKKHVIDNGGIATEDLVAADFNADGWIDFVAGGRATHNVKLYLNQGAEQKKP